MMVMRMTLQDVIEDNISYFWNNDPIIWCDENGCYKEEPTLCNGDNVYEFWIAFRDWCVEDCKENFDGHGGEEFIEESVIEEAVLANFDIWLNWNK